MNSGKLKEEHHAALLQSLFAKNVPGSLITKVKIRQSENAPWCSLTAEAKIGQFFPGSAGSVNTVSGFEGETKVNLWTSY